MKNINEMERELNYLVDRIPLSEKALVKALLLQTAIMERAIQDVSSSIDELIKEGRKI